MSAGHARERRPGTWELRAYVGRDPLTGRKRYETRTVHAKGKREVNRLLADFVSELNGAGATASGTFGDLLEKWYARRAPDLTPAGARETRRVIDTYLEALRDVRLDVLASRTGTAVLDEFYAALRARGGRCRKRREPCPPASWPCEHGGGAELSAATVDRMHHTVRAALELGVRWGWIPRNPAELADVGDIEEREVDPPSVDELLRLFELAEAHDPDLVVLLVVGAVTGQRRGALTALWWEDLDLDAGVATFTHVLSLGINGPERIRKGRGRANRKGGKHVANLDAGTVAVLRAHRARADARARLAGRVLEPTGYVFAGDGVGERPWHPSSVSRWFRQLRDQAGLDPETHFHDLRHFVVTTLLGAGFAAPTVAARVGHSRRATTTLAVYGHRQDDADRAAAELLGRLLERSPVAATAHAPVVPLRAVD